MKSLSSLEILRLVDEFRFLKGSIISKIYHYDKELRIKLYMPAKGSFELFVNPSSIYLTKKHEEMKTSNFTMILRKYMKGRTIENIVQRDFDRIIEIRTKDNILILELFHRGNYILADSNYNIIMPLESQKWKDREVLKNKKYMPPPGIDIRTNLEKALMSNDSIIALLTKNGFGKYSEELLSMTKIDKNKKSSEINDEEKKRIISAMHELFNKELSPKIIYENEKIVDAVPFEMNMYKNLEKKKFSTFSEALDEFFLSTEKKSTKEDCMIKKQEKILEKQKETIEKWVKEEQEIEKNIELIKNHYHEIKSVVEKINELKKKHDWNEIKKDIEKGFVKKIDVKNCVIIFSFDSDLELDFRHDLNKILKKYYEGKKKIKGKKDRAFLQTEKTRTEIRKVEIRKDEKVVKKDEKKWYHKFNYFFTSDNFLVVAGKDAKTNELLVKKYMKGNDIVFHAEIQGSPFAILKAEEEITDNAISEAAAFTACYSKAWAMGLGAIDVYWVRPDQIDKSAPSGEYIGKGSFMIHGQKNYIKNVQIKLALGIFGNEIIIGPEKSISKKTKNFVILQPGETKAHDLAKKIKKKLIEKAPNENIAKIKLDKIQNRIPAGRGMLIS